MRCYTVYFPKPQDLPPNLQDPAFRLGDLKLVDGVEVDLKIGAISLGNDSGRLAYLPLSKAKPPEIDNGHVFAGELRQDKYQTSLEISPTTTPRHATEKAVPILLRVKLFCAQGSKVESFYRVITEPVQLIQDGEGIFRTDDHRRIFWQDLLFVITQGGVLQIRPAGAEPAKDFVVRYTGIGINFLTLEQFLSLSV